MRYTIHINNGFHVKNRILLINVFIWKCKMLLFESIIHDLSFWDHELYFLRSWIILSNKIAIITFLHILPVVMSVSFIIFPSLCLQNVTVTLQVWSVAALQTIAGAMRCVRITQTAAIEMSVYLQPQTPKPYVFPKTEVRNELQLYICYMIHLWQCSHFHNVSSAVQLVA